MTADDELVRFVRDALGRGATRQQVEAVLLAAGWSAQQVKQALRAFADVEFAVPVPRPRPYQSARETFQYVLMFATLYAAAYSLGSLLFLLIERYLPDPAMPADAAGILMGIRWALSALIVSTPVFLYMATVVERGVRADPTRRLSKMRRQLTYVTLFVASCLLIGDVTTVIYNFLSGELTARFVLKVVVVAGIAGTAFTYYLADVRESDREIAS